MSEMSEVKPSGVEKFLTFLMEHIADISNPLNAAAKSALTKIEKL